MKRIFIFLILTALIFSGCGKGEVKRKAVSATIFPLYDFVRNIVDGTDIEVNLIVPPGESPHTFSLTPEEVKKIEGSRIVFYNDFGLDEWIISSAKSIGVEKLVNVNKTLTPINGNPHFWLSIPYAIKECETIKDSLIEEFPEYRETFEKNFNTYKEKLLSLHERIKKSIDKLKEKRIITYHPAYLYFAKEYGLKVVYVIEKSPGKEPTPREIAEIEDIIKNENIKVLFIEPQLSSSVVDGIVSDTGVKVFTLDPLGGTPDRDSYLKLMNYNLNTILEALGEDCGS